jgi:uncharacterized protein (TIGR02594 family)
LHYVVLIHGIRTRADWQEMVRGVLERDDNVRVRPIRYGKFDLLSFLLPGPTRRAPINRTKKILSLVVAEARKNNGIVSVIAHSYGTYTVTQILEDDRSIELKHLILCGSIVDADYDWPGTRGQISGIVVNDYGVRDIWPVFARWATVGYGATGTYGFYANIVEDRLHNKRHSDFFDPNFVKEFWQPLISSDKFVRPEFDDGKIPSSPGYFEILNFRFIWIFLLTTCLFVTNILFDRINFRKANIGTISQPITISPRVRTHSVQSEKDEVKDSEVPLGAPSDMEGINWLTIAQKEVGITEVDGAIDNPRILEYFRTVAAEGIPIDENIPWVGIYAAWVMKNAGCKPPEQPAMALNWKNWGVPLKRPKAGAIAVFRRGDSGMTGHVGFYISEDATGINVISGNVLNSVRAVKLDRTKIVGYRWPTKCRIATVQSR